jgi:hypothetical protein
MSSKERRKTKGASMKKWMNRLAEKHRTMRETYPEDEVIIVFDIDDTILDLRHMVLHVLQSFDRRHGTGHFQDLELPDITVTEAGVHGMTKKLQIPWREEQRVVSWFREHCWSPPIVRNAHHPFPGAMDVIRWLQAQPRTVVGLNTGRPEVIRKETLQCLRGIGRPHGVAFGDELLFMSRYRWGEKITESKVDGIRYFRESGYRVAAFVDNEPENLRIVGKFDVSGEILLLHADTIFGTERERIPQNAISGRIYDVAELSGDGASTDEFGRAA